jgi:hypothetical protein
MTGHYRPDRRIRPKHQATSWSRRWANASLSLTNVPAGYNST